MSALVRITTGIMPQHSRVGMSRAMAQFGEVIHCHKPPYSGIAGEDFVNVRFANQDAADRAYAALKANQVFVDGFQVGVGPTPSGGAGGGEGKGGKGGGKGKGGGYGGGPPAIENYHHNGRRRSASPPRHFARNRQRSPMTSRRGGGGRSPRRQSPPRANFPSRGDPKSPSPRRWAREMHMTTKEQQDRMRSRSRSRSRSAPAMPRGPPPRRYQERASEFSGGNMAIAGPTRTRTARTPSPDPPGPAKNMAQVKNPFYRGGRSPSPASSHRSMGYGQAVEAN